MAMAEDVVVVMSGLFHLLAVDPQVFACFSLESLIALGICDPAFARPSVGDGHSEIRMDSREQPLTNLAVKKLLEEFVCVVAGAEAIAMADHQLMLPHFE